MMNPPPPMRMPPEPDEPRNRPESNDVPLDGGTIAEIGAETGGRCCLGVLLPLAAFVSLAGVLVLRI